MGHQTRPAPRPPRPNRTGQTDDTASAGESPAAKNTLRARRAADLASCQPGLDADQISLYRHHQCLRALQRGTLRARQDFGGVPRTHQFLITLMVHTTKLKPAGHATDHIGKINDEWPPRDSHPERRSTCRGPYTIAGYFDAPDHNKAAFTTDGFYRTGDLAAVRAIDGRGYISIEGRIKDVINRGGEKINAEEVEVLLMRHPRITAAAVVAMPDPRLGERTCAYLVSGAGTGLTMHDVQTHLDSLGVAKFKWPERLEWLPALPQTNVGKVDKKRLRADIAAQVEAERKE